MSKQQDNHNPASPTSERQNKPCGDARCVCGHTFDEHGGDGYGQCGATKTCRGRDGCRAFTAVTESPASPAEVCPFCVQPLGHDGPCGFQEQVTPTSEGREEPPTECVSVAMHAARHSKCRSKRGVVIFDQGRVIVAGFNHRPDGGCDGSDSCKSTCRTTAVHAEQDALIRAARAVVGAEMLHVKIDSDGQLDISGPPSCAQCSKLILRAGITRIWLFGEDGWKSYGAGVFHDMSVTADKDAALRATLAQKDEEIARLKGLCASAFSYVDKGIHVAPEPGTDPDGWLYSALDTLRKAAQEPKP